MADPARAQPNPSIFARIHDVAFEFSCMIHRLFFKVFFGGIFLVCHVLLRLQYSMGRILYFSRGHDTALIHHSPAFSTIGRPNIELGAPSVGDSGCRLGDMYAFQGPDIPPRIPHLTWTLPTHPQNVPKVYALVCEDPDCPVPGKARLHCLFYNIGQPIRKVRSRDLRPVAATPFRTNRGFGYVNIKPHGPYSPPDPLFGHGEHRYIFTIIALKERISFPAPEKVTKNSFLEAIDGKVVDYGQWECRYGCAWSNS